MNPVLYFDELDKISSGSDGEEISNLLCHITDPSQNSQFEDKYFAGIPIDLSNVIFIFSFNDESKINPILKDRIHIIRTEGLTKKQKIHIVRHYILPEIKQELPNIDIKMEDDVISYIIENHTGREKGVRNLKRAVYTICRKLNLHSLLSGEIKTFTKVKKADIESQIVSRDMVEELLKTQVPKQDEPPIGMYS
jgi:ATP-dependent Lon protease